MQMQALRRHYLPLEDDSTESLATALWLDERFFDHHAIAVAKGIDKAFGG